jgi:hypothetical protein
MTNVAVTVRFKPVAGKVDRAAGNRQLSAAAISGEAVVVSEGTIEA